MNRFELLGAIALTLSLGCFLGCSPSSTEKAAPDAKPEKTVEAAKVTKTLSDVKVGVWTQDWDAALQTALEKKLPVLVNFTGSDWCGWCKLMDREVFSKDAWKKYAEKNLILVKIDFPNNKTLVPEKFVGRNKKLAKNFGIRGFPTFVLLKPDGKSEYGRLGASRTITPEIFIQRVEKKIKEAASAK